MTSTTKRAYVTSATASTTNTNFSVFSGEYWINGGLAHFSQPSTHLSRDSHLPKRIGILASIAPTMVQMYIESHNGNGWLVICARIICPTTCANCRPQAQRKGTNAGELMISELLKVGWFSHATCSSTDTGNGSRYNSGFTTGPPEARRALNTLM
jgi:hypothetical protein